VVLMAGRADTTRAQEAMAKLCQTYWYPLYSYVRRCGYPVSDAQDLTQEFFLRLIAGNWIAQADKERGRFRSFLLASLKHFLANEWRKDRAAKRGGDVQVMPLELDIAETRYGREPSDTATPDRHYERRWAVTLLDEVLMRMESEFEKEGNRELFTELKPCLVGERANQPYAQLATKLGMSESAVKVAVHRMRGRYRKLLREEIAQTVASNEEVDSEMRHLLRVLSAG
jgi:RNA polymerase sigma-70 factor (ECF subfamily)